MRISGSGVRQADTSSSAVSAIDQQIRQLEKKKASLQKKMANQGGNAEAISKQLQQIETQIVALRASRDAAVQAAKNSVPPAQNVEKTDEEKPAGESSKIEGTEKAGKTEKSERTEKSADDSSVESKKRDRFFKTPPGWDDEPEIYELERDEKGELKIEYHSSAKKGRQQKDEGSEKNAD